MHVLLYLLATALYSVSALADTEKSASWTNWQTARIESKVSLSRSTVTAIDKVSDDDLWIGTTEGVFRFDGSEFQEFKPAWKTRGSHPVNRVLGFVKGRNSSVYMFTRDDGIYSLADNDSEFRPVLIDNTWTQGANIKGLVILRKARLAAAIIGRRVFVYSADNNRVNELPINIDYATTHPTSLIKMSGNEIWVVMSDGDTVRVILREGSLEPAGTVSCLPGNINIISQSAIGHGEVYLIDRLGKVSRWHLSLEGCRNLNLHDEIHQALPREYIAGYVKYLPSSGIVAIGTDSGTLLYDGDTASMLNTTNSAFASNQSLSIEELSKDFIWVGTFLGAYSALKSDRILIDRFDGESDPWVVSVDGSPELGTFIATYDKVYRENKSTRGRFYQSIELPEELSSISTLKVGAEGIWIGEQQGRVFFMPGGIAEHACKIEVPDSVRNTPITSIEIASYTAERALISSLKGELFVTNKCALEDSIEFIPRASQSNRLVGAARSLGMTWAIDLDGAHQTNGTQWRTSGRISADVFEKRRTIDGAWIVASNDEVVFAAFPDGTVSRLGIKNADSEHMAEVDSFPSIGEAAYALEVDEAGRPWIASRSGVWLADDEKKFRLQVNLHNLSQLSVDYGASHRSFTGELYFGGTGGLVVITSPLAFPNTKAVRPPIVTLSLGATEVKIDSKQSGRNMIVKSGGSPLEIGLGHNGFYPQPDSRYQFKLDNFDSEWSTIEVAKRIKYSKLPPGDYLFRARGANSMGVWSDDEVTFAIHVQHPIWRSWEALTLYMVIGLGGFFGWSRYHDRRVIEIDRLAHAEEAHAAIARYEDDYQETLEANEHLLRYRVEAAKRLVDLFSILLGAQKHSERTLDLEPLNILGRHLAVIQTVEDLALRTVYHESVNLHSVFNELAAQSEANSAAATQAIVLNDLAEDAIPLAHAEMLCVVLHEALDLMSTPFHLGPPTTVEPVVTFSLPPSIIDSNGGVRYRISVSDTRPPFLNSDDASIDLSTTWHIIETFGGSLKTKFDRGNTLLVELVLPAVSSPED